MNEDEELLFKHAPKARKLLKESKRLDREQQRHKWWMDNKPKERKSNGNG